MFADGKTVPNSPPADYAPVAPRSGLVQAMGLRLVAWCKTCGEYYAAAAMYEQLAALSDAELTRRGLSRATLARDVCAAHDRS